jgi:hypothetical protein
MTGFSARLTHPVRLALLASLFIGALLTIDDGVVSGGAPPSSPGRAPSGTMATALHWSTPGTSFGATSSGQVWDINYLQDCVYSPVMGGGSLWMERGLELPDGAHISRVELSAVDADATSNSALWLVVRDLNLNVADSYRVMSAGSPGTSVWGIDVDITVDNYNYLYTLAWDNYGVTGTNIALCGVIVTYDMPSSTFLPYASRNSQ